MARPSSMNLLQPFDGLAVVVDVGQEPVSSALVTIMAKYETWLPRVHPASVHPFGRQFVDVPLFPEGSQQVEEASSLGRRELVERVVVADAHRDVPAEARNHEGKQIENVSPQERWRSLARHAQGR